MYRVIRIHPHFITVSSGFLLTKLSQATYAVESPARTNQTYRIASIALTSTPPISIKPPIQPTSSSCYARPTYPTDYLSADALAADDPDAARGRAALDRVRAPRA